MVFEQSKELNRLAYPLPSWRDVWRLFQVLSPFWLLGVLLATEFNFVKSHMPLAICLAVGTVEVTLLAALMVVVCRYGPCLEWLTKRILRIEEDGIHVESSGKWKIPWKSVRSIQVKLVDGRNEFKQLTVQYVRTWLQKRPYSCSYVFTEAQCEAAVAELKRGKDAAGVTVPIELGPSAVLSGAKVYASWWEVWLMVLSFIPFFHGLPMLATCVLFWNELGTKEAGYHRVFGAAISWIPPHELRPYLLVLGLILTAVGSAGVFGISARVEKRKKQAAQPNLDGASC